MSSELRKEQFKSLDELCDYLNDRLDEIRSDENRESSDAVGDLNDEIDLTLLPLFCSPERDDLEHGGHVFSWDDDYALVLEDLEDKQHPDFILVPYSISDDGKSIATD